MIIEVMKKNDEIEGLKQWTITNIEEDPRYDKRCENALCELFTRLEARFKVSKWKESGDFVKEFVNFRQKDEETPKQYMQRFEMLETRLRNLGLFISDMLLSQHFLQKANLKDLTVQAILA